MSINKITLPDILFADLFKNVLVHLSDKALPNDNQPIPVLPLTFEGGNRKNIIVMVKYPERQELPIEPKQFLVTVLGACGLTLEDIAIINIGVHMAELRQLKTLNPKSILLFGISASDLAFETVILPFTVTLIDQIFILSAPNLEQLSENNEESKLLKGKLWINLKQIYSISNSSGS